MHHNVEVLEVCAPDFTLSLTKIADAAEKSGIKTTSKETSGLMDNISIASNISMDNDTMGLEAEIPLVTFEFIVHGLLILFIGFLGIIGNVLCLIVLCQPQMRNTINCLLIGLAIIDISLIVSAWLMFSLPAFQIYFERRLLTKVSDVYQYTTPFVYPVGMIAQTASVYLTVTITMERYLVVCMPLKSRSICTYGRAKRCVVLIMTSAIVYNISRFFEYKFETFQVLLPIGRNVTLTFLQSTHLRDNPMYISLYMTWMYMIFMYVIPFAILFVLNAKIALEIRSARQKRSQMTIAQQAEEGLAIMLLVIVCTFMLCNAPAMVSNIMEALAYQAVKLTQVSNLLIVINSSLNIIVYVIFCKKFRTILVKMFQGKTTTSRVILPVLNDETWAAAPNFHKRVLLNRNTRGQPQSQSLPLTNLTEDPTRASLIPKPRREASPGHFDLGHPSQRLRVETHNFQPYSKRAASCRYRAGIPSLNAISVKATAVEAWKAHKSKYGPNGSLNPFVNLLFAKSSSRARAGTAGVVPFPLRTATDTFVWYAATVWNHSKALRKVFLSKEAATRQLKQVTLTGQVSSQDSIPNT
eukprot:snap_masked-scaffold138_size318692-processed-gene-2.2 protein:Tk02754 transcript:snap_masked-scaffold138_size318692-processed-gene-2.2-mRNA-1 annotation:"fmrfamide receptor"